MGDRVEIPKSEHLPVFAFECWRISYPLSRLDVLKGFSTEAQRCASYFLCESMRKPLGGPCTPVFIRQ